MTDNKNIPGTQLISGEQSQRIFEGLNRGMSRRDALRMLGLAGIAAAGAGSLFGPAGQVLAASASGERQRHYGNGQTGWAHQGGHRHQLHR